MWGMSALKEAGVSVKFRGYRPRVKQRLTITNLTDWFSSWQRDVHNMAGAACPEAAMPDIMGHMSPAMLWRYSHIRLNRP